MKVLAIGAHPDDIELGCGATLLAHRRRGDSVSLLVMSSGERGPLDAVPRALEQQNAAELLNAELRWGGFPDGSVPQGHEAVELIEAARKACGADIVYTHAPDDSHQDHRATALASLAACRRVQRVCLYEAPSSRHFDPSIYVDVEDLVEDKLRLIGAHRSQVLKNGLVDLEAVSAQARYRGFQARIRHAEAFESTRFVWDLSPVSSIEAMELDLVGSGGQ